MPTMRDFELFIPFEKTVNEDGSLKLFGGIASSTSVDKDNERMDKAVLNKIASDLRKNSTVFFNHDLKGLGVGTVASSEVVNNSVRISVVPTKAEGMRDVITQIQEGVLKSFSIGGKIKDWEDQFDEKLGKKVRTIKDVDCYEVSVVGIPANGDASILSYMSKSFNPGDLLEKATEKAEVAPEVLKKEAVPEKAPEQAVKGVDEILASEGFKKVFSDFEKSHEAKFAEMQKSFDAQKAEMQASLAAANARIEELHKALDAKAEKSGVVSKALAAEAEDMQKEAKTEEGSFAMFPRGRY